MTLEELMIKVIIEKQVVDEYEAAANQLCADLDHFDPATVCQAIDIALTSTDAMFSVAKQIHNLVEGDNK